MQHTQDLNHLDLHCQKLEQATQSQIQRTKQQHQQRLADALPTYPLEDLREQIGRLVQAALSTEEEVRPTFDLISRQKLGGDIALKFPSLLKRGGPKRFMAEDLPTILKALQEHLVGHSVETIEVKGMYINLTLSSSWLIDCSKAMLKLGARFGQSHTLKDRRVIVEYSSPNVAKTLHAGHIRSTIIGHVIAHQFTAAGAEVHRINHINDFGGFGFLLEGFRRFADLFPKDLTPNMRLVEVYRIRRTLEELSSKQAENASLPADQLQDTQRELLDRYFPACSAPYDVKSLLEDFTEAADTRFSKLEAGDQAEVELWQQMVTWSLDDFADFYRSLNVEIEHVLGESFYAKAGHEVVKQALADGKAVVFDEALAEQARAALGEVPKGKKPLTEAEREKALEGIDKDLGATLVQLDHHQRYVVLRKDGRSIYATRDVGALAKRMALFQPTDMIYEVGQEQKVHFDRLFETGHKLNLFGDRDIQLKHVYHGFYVDHLHKKKLSSRAGSASVLDLLAKSYTHFRAKLDSSTQEMTDADKDYAAKQLSVGSIIFNELKQDIKGTVEVNPSDPQDTIERFEKAGGAYVVYSACRARSILDKTSEASAGQALKEDSSALELSADEAELVLKALQLPEKVLASAEKLNPSLVLKHLHELASQYNAYYAKVRVIDNGVYKTDRVAITRFIAQTLVNGLAMCHIECPERI